MKIAVVGTGYVGLVTGTCLAETGNDVTCVDCDRKKIDLLNRGPDPDLRAGPGRTGRPQRGRRPAAASPPICAAAAKKAQLVFLAVGTPPADDGSVDLSALWAVVDSLPRTCATMQSWSARARCRWAPTPRWPRGCKELTGRDIDVASNPEFLKEGVAIDDFMKPDRVVVGVRRPEVVDVAGAICISRTCGPTSRFWPCRPKAPR